MKEHIRGIFETWINEETDDFSGVLSVTGIVDGVICQMAVGHRNRAEELPNTADTAFAVASGTKLFTGLAVCKLIDEGKLSLDDKLWAILPHDLGQIHKDVTVYQLLTHTSGVGDYVDEDAENFDEQMTELYNKYPVHLWESLSYYLQMMTHLPPKFAPGERYGYSNSGYVLLGLVVEAVSGMTYQEFVKNEIIAPLGLTHTGFYRADEMPKNTALGYISPARTNIYGLPILGGSDGGIYTCATDMDKLWRAIFNCELLSFDMTDNFLKRHVLIDDNKGYGLGVYLYRNDVGAGLYWVVGADSGVGFFSGYYPDAGVVVSGFCNTGWEGCSIIFEELLEEFGWEEFEW
ncbi:MAG: beta-lactamase family protein [Defluviitaleaceae bacterium]|nr:beta-lactamase family protein [Defluviitaleaceae bacterium]